MISSFVHIFITFVFYYWDVLNQLWQSLTIPKYVYQVIVHIRYDKHNENVEGKSFDSYTIHMPYKWVF